MTKSFILYQEYKENISFLSQSQKGDLLDAIFAYNEGSELELEPIVKVAFSFIKSSLNRNAEKWSKVKDERSRNGRLGNLRRRNEDLYQKVKNKEMTLEEAESVAKCRKTSQSVANVAVNVNDNVNVNVNDNVNVNVNGSVINNNTNTIKEKNKTLSPFFLQIAERLGECVKKNKNRSLSKGYVEKWADSIRLLQKIELKPRSNPQDDIEKVMVTIEEFFGDKFLPIVESGEAFRKKFFAVESFAQRKKTNKPSSNAFDAVEYELKQEGCYGL